MFLTFMIDGFLDMSTYFQAVAAPRGAKWVDGYETTFLRFEGEFAEQVYPVKPGYLYNGLEKNTTKVFEHRSGKVKAVSFNRKAVAWRPVSVPVPWFGDLDGDYYATVAALWKNFFLAPKRN
jgi:hypothetical protein